MTAIHVVESLLGERPVFEALTLEASIHLPHRGSIWVATFTGPYPGQQLTRSTGLTDRSLALAMAQKWEAEAREQRTAFGHRFKKPTVRVRPRKDSGPSEQMTQKEVATLLGMSERGVREIERRAFAKLRQHPLLRKFWQQHLAGELDEDHFRLDAAEVAALFAIARSPSERQLLQKILHLIQIGE